MKRFLLATLLITVIFGVMLYFVPRPMQSDVHNYARYNPTVNIYCRKTSQCGIDTGLGRQVTCSLSDFKNVFSSCRGVDGVSVTFYGAPDDLKAITARLRAAEVSRQQLGDLTVVCCFSPLLSNRASIDGKYVNVQIAYRNGVVTVGYPLILGSY